MKFEARTRQLLKTLTVAATRNKKWIINIYTFLNPPTGHIATFGV